MAKTKEEIKKEFMDGKITSADAIIALRENIPALWCIYTRSDMVESWNEEKRGVAV